MKFLKLPQFYLTYEITKVKYVSQRPICIVIPNAIWFLKLTSA